MKSVLQSLFGTYTPVTDLEHIWNPSTETYDVFTRTVDGLGGVDWVWIAGVVLFAIVLVSFFKVVGAVIKKL